MNNCNYIKNNKYINSEVTGKKFRKGLGLLKIEINYHDEIELLLRRHRPCDNLTPLCMSELLKLFPRDGFDMLEKKYHGYGYTKYFTG